MVHYGTPFKLFTVLLEPKDPRAGKRRQFKDRAPARKLAAKIMRKTGAVEVEVFWESRVYYAKEYCRGRSSRRVSTGQETKELALAWCKAREREGLGPVAHKAKLLAEALEEWLQELEVKGRAAKTLRDYRIQVRYWQDHLGNVPVSTITRDSLVAFFKERKGGPRLKNLNRGLWRTFSRWSLKRGYAELDPTVDLEPWKEPQREPRVLTEEEVSRLLRACQDKYKVQGITGKRNVGGIEGGASKEAEEPWSQEYLPPAELEGIVTLALTSLLRLGSVLSITWGDLDLQEDLIHVPAERTKTRREMVIPLSRTFKRWVTEKATKGSGMDRVFGVAEIKHSFGSALKRAKIRGASFHCLRKTAGTILRRKGIALEVVKKLGGWSTGKDVFLSDYRHVSMEELREAVEVLDKLLGAGSGPVEGRQVRQGG